MAKALDEVSGLAELSPIPTIQPNPEDIWGKLVLALATVYDAGRVIALCSDRIGHRCRNS